ncbi:MAG: cadherin-like domain-containing protein [Betaproteobacteria bacterium]|nr:cadherin-like domain-containing protein [Betaproteobacteria bacterium]
MVTFTPNLNASGTDAFTYTVTVGTQVSNTATATLNITPVNDAPVAVNDSASAIANIAKEINVLANDTDPDGTADIVAAVNVTQPTPAGSATTSVSGGVVTFSATAAGTYTFTYQAQDASGAISANTATVTVTVAAGETLTILKNEYVSSKGMLKAQGTVSPAANQTVKLEFVNSLGTVLGQAGTYTTDGVGNWQAQTTVALPAGASALKATTSNGSVRAVALVLK